MRAPPSSYASLGRRGHAARTRSFRPRLRLGRALGLELARAQRAHRTRERAAGDARVFLHRGIAIERVMARRIRLVVADVAIDPRLEARPDEPHPVEPVAQRAARGLDARDV